MPVQKRTWEATLALMAASHQGNIEVLRMLLDAGADEDLADHRGDTSLIVASDKGHVQIVHMLLDADAEKNVSSNNGFTALLV